MRVCAHELRIGGFVPFTATDYPDHLAAVVFCQGCPWRCGYCHNPHLLAARGKVTYEWPLITAFLATRRGLLDAVVFSGGEPTLQDALPAAMREVRDMGFKVGLHTAGVYPRKLAAVLPLADWVGMDVKAPFESYERVTGVASSGKRACRSAEHVIASGVAHEFRTTVDRSVLSETDLAVLAERLPRMGARRYVLQARG
jgi:pyruvate formate lyase activating enzyme